MECIRAAELDSFFSIQGAVFESGTVVLARGIIIIEIVDLVAFNRLKRGPVGIE